MKTRRNLERCIVYVVVFAMLFSQSSGVAYAMEPTVLATASNIEDSNGALEWNVEQLAETSEKNISDVEENEDGEEAADISEEIETEINEELPKDVLEEDLDEKLPEEGAAEEVVEKLPEEEISEEIAEEQIPEDTLLEENEEEQDFDMDSEVPMEISSYILTNDSMPTQRQIAQKWNELKINLGKVDKFEKSPNKTDGGKLDQATLNNALNVLNFARYVGGLSDDVALDEALRDMAQKAAYVNWLNNKMTHEPGKPGSVSQAFFDTAYKGASQSNLFSGSWSLNMPYCVTGWLNDAGVVSLGHRLWALAPGLTQTGFGAVPASDGKWSQYALHVVGNHRNDRFTEPFYTWPAQNMPIELYAGGNYHFSVMLNGKNFSKPDSGSVKVTLTRGSSTWKLTTANKDIHGKYLKILDTNMYTAWATSWTLDFHAVDFSNNDTVHVKIEGLTDKNGDPATLEYDVNFFSVSDYKQKVESITIEKHAAEAYVFANKTMQFGVTEIAPEDATDKTVVWKVNNIAGEGKIDSKGVFTGTKEGDVEVYAASKDGGAKSNAITIHVYPPKQPIVELIGTTKEYTYTGKQIDVISGSVTAKWTNPIDGIEHSISTENAVVEYFSDSACKTVITPENIKNAKTYYLRVKLPVVEDYELSYSDAIPIVVNKRAMEDPAITVEGIEASYPFSSAAIKPIPIVKLGDVVLKVGTDYTLSYANNTNVSKTAKVIITAKSSNFLGTKEVPFEITKANIGNAEEGNHVKLIVSKIADVVYNGSEQKPKFTVKYGGVTLNENIDYRVNYSDNVNVGRGKVTITALEEGNYEGVGNAEFVIKPAALSSYLQAGKLSNYAYTGLPIKPEYTYNKKLIINQDFTVDYGEYVNPGTGKLIFSGIGNYTGNVTLTYKITAKSIEEGNVKDDEMIFSLEKKAYTYNGKNITPSVTVTHKIDNDHKEVLTKGKDYTLSYSNNKNAGEGKVTITGKGKYSGKRILTFAINQLDLADNNADISYSIAPASYSNGTEVKPSVKLSIPSTGVTISGGDYVLEYSNNKEATKGKEKAHVTVIAKGNKNIKGSRTVDFEIGKSIADVKIENLPTSVEYSGRRISFEDLYLYFDGNSSQEKKELEKGTYTVDYGTDNQSVGTVKVTITAKENSGYVGSVSKTFKITPKKLISKGDNANCEVFPISDMTYTGKNLTPEVVIRDTQRDEILTLGEDYTVRYSSNKNAGIGKITIKGKGNYSGTLPVETFAIHQLNLDDSNVNITVADAVYTGKAVKAVVKIQTSEGVTVPPSEYSLAYENNVELSNVSYADTEPRVTIQAKDEKNIAGQKVIPFRIAYKLSDLKWSGMSSSVAYPGEGKEVTFAGLKLSTKDGAAVAFPADTVLYENNQLPGTAKITITAPTNSKYTGTVTKTFKITAAKAADAFEIIGVPETVKYTGIAHKPSITVKDKRTNEVLKEGIDYTVKYSSNTAIGNAKIIVSGKKKYSGSTTKTFKIVW